MKISGKTEVATIPEVSDLSKQKINFSESFTEVDSEYNAPYEFSLPLARDDADVEIIPAQFSKVKLLHILARFPGVLGGTTIYKPVTAMVGTIGIKLAELYDYGNGAGSLNTLTDSDKSWMTDEHIDRTLVDSAGTEFAITDSDKTTVTVSGTPASGNYRIISDLGDEYYICREILLRQAGIAKCQVVNNEKRVKLLKPVAESWHTLTVADIGKIVAYLGGAPTDQGTCLGYDNTQHYIWVLTDDAFSNTSTAIIVDGETSSDNLSEAGSLDGEDAQLDIILVGHTYVGT